MAQKNKSRSEHKPNQMGGVPHLPNLVWLSVFFVLGAACMLGLHQAFPSLLGEDNDRPNAPAQVSKGPWGELEYTTLNLERPDDSFPPVIPDPQPFQWFFENYSRQQVEQLLAKAGLTAEQKNSLMDPQRWKAATNGWQLSPTMDVVRQMSLSARSNIYCVLRKSTNNSYMVNPCRFEEDKFEAWLSDSGLNAEKQQLMRDLSLHEQGFVNFYDGLLLEWMTPDRDERKRIAKAMTRYPTLVMRLHVTPQSDLDALERYWAQGRRGTRMRPFLESLAKVPQGLSTSVSFFFPTFARMRLYSYPDMSNPELAHRKNCFYTALNFFNETPDYNFLNGDAVIKALRSDYNVVKTNFVFGDVMVFGDSRQLIHACVYIADDVVFTKNGANYLAPWVLMKRADMLREFDEYHSLTMTVYRKKNI